MALIMFIKPITMRTPIEHEWNTITWIDAQNNIQFSIDGNFDADDILHIAESVSLVNSTK